MIVTRGFRFSELWCGLRMDMVEGMMGMEMEMEGSDSREKSRKEGEVHNTANFTLDTSAFPLPLSPSLPLSLWGFLGEEGVEVGHS